MLQLLPSAGNALSPPLPRFTGVFNFELFFKKFISELRFSGFGRGLRSVVGLLVCGFSCLCLGFFLNLFT